jgi:hypothetical protein
MDGDVSHWGSTTGQYASASAPNGTENVACPHCEDELGEARGALGGQIHE